MFAGEWQTLGGALDVPLRGGESKGSDMPLAPTGVLSLTAVGSESIPLSDEFSSELLCALGDVALYRTDGDAVSTAATLVLLLEDGGRLDLGITAERRFAVDGVLYRAENADTLLDLLADAGIKFSD